MNQFGFFDFFFFFFCWTLIELDNTWVQTPKGTQVYFSGPFIIEHLAVRSGVHKYFPMPNMMHGIHSPTGGVAGNSRCHVEIESLL